MHLLLPLIAVGIIAIISLVSAKKVNVPEKKIPPTPSHSISKSATPSIKTNAPQVTVIIKSQTTPPTLTPTSPPQANNFIYPGSVVVSVSGQTTNLTSYDNPNVITDWYKNQIKSQGMNTTSFVVTNTNGNVNNVLAGAKNGEDVKITITKNANDSTVYISITGKNP